jgi:hypothetical protein
MADEQKSIFWIPTWIERVRKVSKSDKDPIRYAYDVASLLASSIFDLYPVETYSVLSPISSPLLLGRFSSG